VWAGRTATKQQIDRLLRKMQLAPTSALHLLWANFGMGKTHTLLHIQHLCELTQGRLIPVYAVMAQRPSGFLDLYRAIVSVFPHDLIADRLVEIGRTWSGSLHDHPLFSKSPGIVSALLAMRGADPAVAVTARQWLIGQPGLSARDLRAVGVTYRIKTAEDAINALSALTALAVFPSAQSTKLVLMIDEYERIGLLKPRTRDEINGGLHTYFNAKPTGMELILSFSFGRQDNVSYLLSPELRSRAEPLAISLDVLTKEEAIAFFRDLLSQFRLKEDGRWAYPFSPGALQAIVEHVAGRKSLTPRRLMVYANHALLESQAAREPTSATEIGVDEVRQYLADPRLGEIDTDQRGLGT
jgi:hypothetical protein